MSAEIFRKLLLREESYMAIFLVIVAILTMFDIYEDSLEGAHLTHLSVEFFAILLSLLVAGYLWRRSLQNLRDSNLALTDELERTRSDVVAWRSRTEMLYSQLNREITAQLQAWKLSDAESQVTLLLLKGMSHKEIADTRGTNEHTIRQQARSVYQKSGLAGRAQLAAFFLEDLLHE